MAHVCVLLQGRFSPPVNLEGVNIRAQQPRKHVFLGTTDVWREQTPRSCWGVLNDTFLKQGGQSGWKTSSERGDDLNLS